MGAALTQTLHFERSKQEENDVMSQKRITEFIKVSEMSKEINLRSDHVLSSGHGRIISIDLGFKL